jgi:hypothetical protein
MLNLPIKDEWFRKIDRGEKPEEYREIKPYWTKRFITAGLLNADGSPSGRMAEITLTRGYGKDAPQLAARVVLGIGQGRAKWGAEPGKEYYRLDILRTRRIR